MALLEIGLLLVLLVLLWSALSRRKTLACYPGPTGLPILGNGHQIDMAKPQLTYEAWSKKYGGVYKITLFGRNALVLNSYELIYEVLVTKGKDFAGRGLQSFRTTYLTRGNSDILFTNPTPQWHLLRKTAHRHFKMYASGMARVERINMEIIQMLVQAFRKSEGQDFNPKEVIYNTIMNITCLFAVGKKYNLKSKEFSLFMECEKLLFKNTSFAGRGVELDFLPWLRFLCNETYKGLQQFVKTRDELLSLMVKFVEENINNDNEDIVEGVIFELTRLLKGQDNKVKGTEVEITQDHIEMVTMNFIFAGTGTTVSSYYGFLNIIAQHPEIQERLQKEVDDVVGTSRIVTLSDRDQMPYTRATILENLRFGSVVPMGVPHCTLKDTTLQGKPVPAGTDIFTNLFALHHDEYFWGDPYKFRPERFLDEDGQLLPPSSEVRRHLMPFGAGPRVCLGEILALTRIFLLLSTTSQVFNVKPGKVITTYDPREYQPGSINFQKDYDIKFECRNWELFKTDIPA